MFALRGEKVSVSRCDEGNADSASGVVVFVPLAPKKMLQCADQATRLPPRQQKDLL